MARWGQRRFLNIFLSCTASILAALFWVEEAHKFFFLLLCMLSLGPCPACPCACSYIIDTVTGAALHQQTVGAWQ